MKWKLRIATALPILLGCLGLVLPCPNALALAMEQVGPDKPDHPTMEEPDWHKGIVELTRHPSRVYSVWVNGSETFYFQASPDAMNKLITLFSKARLRDHEIRFEPGTNSVKALGSGAVISGYNVSLQATYGIALAFTREKDSAETLEPRLTIYVGENPALPKQLKLPENIHVRSGVPGLDFPGQPAVPSRQVWFGRVQFDDGKPAVDFESGLQTTITLWDNDSPDGIPLGHLTSDAIIRTAFSESELADLKSGRSWLTVTLGNYLAQSKRSDPKFPPELLAADEQQAGRFQISRPLDFYYGRILFDDGSPAVLTNAPGGQEIFVDFPYAGRGKLDAEGYFKVYLTPDQFADLGKRKPNKNIYVPVDAHTGRAADTFPPELLSHDQAHAGVVKIARPVLTQSK